MQLLGLRLSEIFLILFLVGFGVFIIETLVHYESVFETLRRKGIRATLRLIIAIMIHDFASIFVK